jgi:(p)ppGpp synthase/HD superfamily hydrolase
MLSERFTQALTYAHELHATQKRKAGDIPYITHLLGVASIARVVSELEILAVYKK